ncbi:MAG: hypothetical protein RMM98_16450 [Acidobacteriota bacterium]|nr:hypothetical protein [Acidobacteriota bacterium]
MAAPLLRTKSIRRLGAFLCAWVGGLCLVIAPSTDAQHGAPDVRVMVGDITDKRTTGQFFAECEVELKIIGDVVAESAGLRAIRIKSASDDTGRDLLKEDKASPPLEGISTEQKTSLEKTIKLKNPARSAKFIKLLEGEVELFQPTQANGGVIIEKRFMARANEPLQSPALKQWNVQITYMTQEGLEAKKKEIEKKQEAGEKIAEAFAQLVQGIFGGMMSADENSLYFVIEDPDGRVVDLAFQNGQGKPIETHSRTRSGALVAYGFSEAVPGPDAQLVIYLATPASLKIVPFKVENIPLP